MLSDNLSFQALILGIVQGLTEFLPISSSAHLILFPWFFGWTDTLVDTLSFDVALHAGTLVAILWYFRKDWMDLARGFFRILARRRVEEVEERLILYIIRGDNPCGFGRPFSRKGRCRDFSKPSFDLSSLDRRQFFDDLCGEAPPTFLAVEQDDLLDSLMIGVAQAIALLPGVSRSGITITTGLLRGYEREAATRFSFLLSTPAIAGAAILHLRHIFSGSGFQDGHIFAIGFFSSAVSGYFAIAFLMQYLRKHTLNVFAGYRLMLAAFIILWIFLK